MNLIECLEDEFHYTEHIWICHSTENCILFVCEHCSDEAKKYTDANNYDGECINLAEYGGCDTPQEGVPNSDGRVYQDGKWWKEGPTWHDLYKEANAIVDPAYRHTCLEAITTYAKCVLFEIPTLETYAAILKNQQYYVAKDKAEQPYTPLKNRQDCV